MSLLQNLYNFFLEPSIKFVRTTSLTCLVTVLAIGFRLECRPGRTVNELATAGMTGCLDVRDDFAGYGVDVWSFGRDGFGPAED